MIQWALSLGSQPMPRIAILSLVLLLSSCATGERILAGTAGVMAVAGGVGLMVAGINPVGDMLASGGVAAVRDAVEP